MASKISGINPKILKWAREQAGYSIQEVAIALKKNETIIRRWENGEDAPTYVQLEKIAYTLYKRPLALFFFPEPPRQDEVGKEFRTLPKFEIENLASDTRYALRQAKVMQLTLKELNDGVNPSENKIFRDIQITYEIPINKLVALIRAYLGITLKDQTKWKNNRIAFKKWRDLIQKKGIFIFKRSFKQIDISGFSLIDTEFPIIYVNNSTAISRQIFTIFHELAHILLHNSGITKTNDNYIDSLKDVSKKIEIFCNRFAADFLVPESDFKHWTHLNPHEDENITKIAKYYCVSREVILRKFYDKSLVDRNYYEKKIIQWNKEYQKNRKLKYKESKVRGNYYPSQVSYFGERFLELAFSRYYKGYCSLEQLADYFNMKINNVLNLEQYFLGKKSK